MAQENATNKQKKKIQQKLVISLILSSWISQKEYHPQLSMYVTTTLFQLQQIPVPIEGETHQDIFTGQRKKAFPGCSIAGTAKSQSQKQWLPFLRTTRQNVLSQLQF